MVVVLDRKGEPWGECTYLQCMYIYNVYYTLYMYISAMYVHTCTYIWTSTSFCGLKTGLVMRWLCRKLTKSFLRTELTISEEVVAHCWWVRGSWWCLRTPQWGIFSEESSVMMMTMSEDSSVRRSKTCSRTDHNQSLAAGQHCARQHCHSFVRLITSRSVKFTIHV